MNKDITLNAWLYMPLCPKEMKQIENYKKQTLETWIISNTSPSNTYHWKTKQGAYI